MAHAGGSFRGLHENGFHVRSEQGLHFRDGEGLAVRLGNDGGLTVEGFGQRDPAFAELSGAQNQNLRIAAEPLPEKRQELTSIFGKCAWYHSNQSGRTPEEREQRRATRTKTTQELDR